mmetsp:Transcript_72226/g.115140  ORF Transcript_72226/g.115140 Transcript_72226/m.115140 type:complete len:645 (-) Transcript_72226:1691-3625(-)
MPQLVNIDESVAVFIERVKDLLSVFLVDGQCLGDPRFAELFEIDHAVSILIEFLHDTLRFRPGVAFGELHRSQQTHQFVHCGIAISVQVHTLELLLHLLLHIRLHDAQNLRICFLQLLQIAVMHSHHLLLLVVAGIDRLFFLLLFVTGSCQIGRGCNRITSHLLLFLLLPAVIAVFDSLNFLLSSNLFGANLGNPLMQLIADFSASQTRQYLVLDRLIAVELLDGIWTQKRIIQCFLHSRSFLVVFTQNAVQKVLKQLIGALQMERVDVVRLEVEDRVVDDIVECSLQFVRLCLLCIKRMVPRHQIIGNDAQRPHIRRHVHFAADVFLPFPRLEQPTINNLTQLRRQEHYFTAQIAVLRLVAVLHHSRSFVVRQIEHIVSSVRIAVVVALKLEVIQTQVTHRNVIRVDDGYDLEHIADIHHQLLLRHFALLAGHSVQDLVAKQPLGHYVECIVGIVPAHIGQDADFRSLAQSVEHHSFTSKHVAVSRRILLVAVGAFNCLDGDVGILVLQILDIVRVEHLHLSIVALHHLSKSVFFDHGLSSAFSVFVEAAVFVDVEYEEFARLKREFQDPPHTHLLFGLEPRVEELHYLWPIFAILVVELGDELLGLIAELLLLGLGVHILIALDLNAVLERLAMVVIDDNVA